MRTMREPLATHPFFARRDDNQTALAAGRARNVHANAGARIFAEGGAADTFHLTRHGRVAPQLREPARRHLLTDTIEDGDVLGWSWLVPPYRWFCDAHAVTATSAIAVDGACLRGKCAQDPRFGYALLRRVTGVMHQRMQAARIRLLDVYGGAHA